eukprot:GHVU01042383.1.p1 GENE.GHVU01042383.1~~GHVU01042383.1.p1  ORF type:complete len:206 (-),score=13.10 GHVU01042383.1:384-1001(-)
MRPSNGVNLAAFPCVLQVLPSNYPYSPPSIYMMTPNGRFEVNQKICCSFSDFHEESWSPSWKVDTMLMALLSFFLDTKDPGLGCIKSSRAEKKRLALQSYEHNRNVIRKFGSLFPDFCDGSDYDLARGGYASCAQYRSALEKKSSEASGSDIANELQEWMATGAAFLCPGVEATWTQRLLAMAAWCAVAAAGILAVYRRMYLWRG